jgi:hypothetical protein
MLERGVLIASDENLEWMLPWWWDRYKKQNQDPVLCVDLGMSPAASTWWKERGLYLRPQMNLPSFEKETIVPLRRQTWEKKFSGINWTRRSAWMHKPFIMGLSPFETTLWLDIDCEVRGSLDPLFNTLFFGADFAIARDPLEEQMYNSGVIVMRKGSSLLQRWQQFMRECHAEFLGDQQGLSHLIHQEQLSFLELPAIYNWSAQLDLRAEVLIRHFHGTLMKMALLMSLRPNLGDNSKLPPAFDPTLF